MRHKKQEERGVALIMALIALLIMTSIGLTMMYMADTETSINSNYRDEQTAYYAAQAGLEEGRDRMRSNAGTGITISASLPAALPGAAGGALYILNATGSESVAPWTTTNAYFDNEVCKEVDCSGGQVPPTSGWYTTVTTNSTYAASPVLPYKWVRITKKIDRSASGWSGGTQNFMYVDGKAANASYSVCSNGTNEFASSTSCVIGTVYMVTALAVTPAGTRRMMQYEVARGQIIPVDAAIDTKLAQAYGSALNVTGNTDPVCSAPNVYGGKSGSSISTPGGGNVTGSPADTLPNATFPYNVAAMISKMQGSATTIDTGGTSVTWDGSGSPGTYRGPHAVLGVVPTVTYDGNGAITAITAPGTPIAYYSPNDLILGTSTIGGTPVNGQGVLLVNGNLTIDITNGFNYFGAILVSGNITFTAHSSTSANSNIHGMIIGGGQFNSNLSNLSGSVFIHQNACMVQSGLDPSLSVVAARELMY